jgi:hypothetical protein
LHLAITLSAAVLARQRQLASPPSGAAVAGNEIEIRAGASDRARDRGRKGNKSSQIVDRQPMTSNIEPIAREITRNICRDNEMPETKIDRWVDLHWQCAAAMLEAGVMDEKGEWIEGKDWRRGLEAYRERFLRSSASETAPVDSDPS